LSQKINLLDYSQSALEQLFLERGYKAFHARQVFKWIHKRGIVNFTQMTDISKILRQELSGFACILPPKIVLEQPSSDGTIKWIVELDEANRVETVLIPDGHRYTLCVSSQVGCALECSFCSTGQQGFNRNLTVAEIIGQVWVVTHEKNVQLTNVVMMGMGEPLANYSAVLAATGMMIDDFAYGLAKTRVTISTSGIVPALLKLTEDSVVSLAVSLHAPNDELRDILVPINKKYPLAMLIPACKAYLREDKRRKITWEYVMLNEVNDSIKHAKQLIRLLEGVPSKVNLIPFNPFPGTDYTGTPPEKVEAFRQKLKKSGLVATTRKTRGDDIDAACGQLVGKVKDKSRRVQRRVEVSFEKEQS